MCGGIGMNNVRNRIHVEKARVGFGTWGWARGHGGEGWTGVAGKTGSR